MTRGRRTRSKSHHKNRSVSKEDKIRDKSKQNSANMIDEYHSENPQAEFKRRGKIEALQKVEETD